MDLIAIREEAGTQKLALVRDANVFYIVLNTKLNLIDYEFIKTFNKYLDKIEK